MTSLAILVGHPNYDLMNPLPCCKADVEAMAALLEATGRYGEIHRIVDLVATDLKDQLRAVLEPGKSPDEVFFYFSGHGHGEDGEFYFCPSDFNKRRPNDTGLSNGELLSMLRETSPKLVVQVVDACSSGAQMVKSDGSFIPADKGELKSIIRMASCLDDQVSLTGERVSEFTERFCLAASRKTQGPVLYTDIMNVLRDDYLENQQRQPHFFTQATHREAFVEDASRLAGFRSTFDVTWRTKPADQLPATAASVDLADDSADPLGLVELLTQAEAKMAKPEDVPVLVNALFDGLKQRLSGQVFGELFELKTAENAHLDEPTTKGFIISVLSRQQRQDEFVTAEVRRERKGPSGFGQMLYGAMAEALVDDDWVENWELTLNISLSRAQMRVELIPKFYALDRIVLVVSCAPSLEQCYVFELATLHKRTDFTSFADERAEVTRRWYKVDWRTDVNWLMDKIADKLEEVVRSHTKTAADRTAKD